MSRVWVAALIHLRYFWLGITSKWCLSVACWAAYCFAPIAFGFPLAVGVWWYASPVGLSILVLIYFLGKHQAGKRHG